MCNFLSCIVMQSGEILCDPINTDSHEDLIEKYGVHDGPCQEGKFCRVEFTPPEDRALLGDLDRWTLKVDEDSTPEWFRHDEVQSKLRDIVAQMLISTPRKFLLGSCWILIDGADVEVVKNARIVWMVGNAKVGVMLGSSQVGVMSDSSQVRVMLGSSQVGVMSDSSRVGVMWENARSG